jgi:toxin ParE1/3/4
MRLRFTLRASQDIVEIADYIHAESPLAARRVRTAILASLQTLVDFPRLGRPQSVEGVHKIVTRKYSYLIYYAIDESADEIVVLTVQHPARQRLMQDE